MEIAEAYEPTVVAAMIEMLEDLHENARDSRFVRKLQGLPLYELKTRARGGGKGGARIYFSFTTEGDALVINAEVKEGVAPSATKIEEALTILLAYRAGADVGLGGAIR